MPTPGRLVPSCGRRRSAVRRGQRHGWRCPRRSRSCRSGRGSRGSAATACPSPPVPSRSSRSARTRHPSLREDHRRDAKGGNKTLLQFFGARRGRAPSASPTVVYDPLGKRFDRRRGHRRQRRRRPGDARLQGHRRRAPDQESGCHRSCSPARRRRRRSRAGSTSTSRRRSIGVTSRQDRRHHGRRRPRRRHRSSTGSSSSRRRPYYAGNDASGGWAADLNSTYDGQAPAVNATKQTNVFVAIPDTNDVTVTTYTGAAKSKAPTFSKNVVYPTNDPRPRRRRSPRPAATTSTSVTWRSPASRGAATSSSPLPRSTCSGRTRGAGASASTPSPGVSLASDETLKSRRPADWFSPGLAIDGAGYVHRRRATTIGTGRRAVAWRCSPARARQLDSRPAVHRQGRRGVRRRRAPGDDRLVRTRTGAALDPTSPWDVWVSGAVGRHAVPAPA